MDCTIVVSAAGSARMIESRLRVLPSSIRSAIVPVAGNSLVTLGAEKNGLNKHEPAVNPLNDSIHPEMKGYLLIHSHPYAGVSDGEGKVKLKNVPVGEWTFVLWHEVNGYITKGTLDGAAAEWPKGRIKIKVEPEVNKIGAIRFK